MCIGLWVSSTLASNWKSHVFHHCCKKSSLSGALCDLPGVSTARGTERGTPTLFSVEKASEDKIFLWSAFPLTPLWGSF